MGPSSPTVLWLTRVSAVAITAAIGVGSFILSFAALRDLAARAGWPHHLAWVWPLIVDGAILMTTMAVVALAPYADGGRARRFFWAVLVASAAVSIGGNGLHAVIPKSVPLSGWLAAAIAMVPPMMLLASTHGLSLLARFRPEMLERPELIAAESPPEPVLPQPAAPSGNWSELAAAITEHTVGEVNHVAVVDVLRLSYERGLTNRSIARQLDIEPKAVAQIVAAGARLLRAEPVGV